MGNRTLRRGRIPLLALAFVLSSCQGPPGVPYRSTITTLEVGVGVSSDMLYANFGPPGRDAARPLLDELADLYDRTEEARSVGDITEAWSAQPGLSQRQPNLVKIAFEEARDEARWPGDLPEAEAGELFARSFRLGVQQYLKAGGVER